MLIKWADGKANIFQKRPGLDGQNGQVCSRGFGLARGVGLARAGGGGRAVRIGNGLTKNDFLLKNVDLGHFWPFLDLLDLKNGSGSKFRF